MTKSTKQPIEELGAQADTALLIQNACQTLGYHVFAATGMVNVSVSINKRYDNGLFYTVLALEIPRKTDALLALRIVDAAIATLKAGESA